MSTLIFSLSQTTACVRGHTDNPCWILKWDIPAEFVLYHAGFRSFRKDVI